MPYLRLERLALTAVLGSALVAGCGAPAVTPPPAQAPAATSTPAAEAPAAGTIRLTGDLVAPGEITAAELAALPQQTVDVSFQSGDGPQQHTETGPALADVIPADALAVDADTRNDLLSFAVLAVGSDGYSAVVAYGDVSADFGNRGLLVAVAEDGAALERPRLVVPGDVRGGRYVSDLVELRVVRLAD